MIVFSIFGTLFGFHGGAVFSYDTLWILQVYGPVGALMADVELCLAILSSFSYILELLSEVLRGGLIGHRCRRPQDCLHLRQRFTVSLLALIADALIFPCFGSTVAFNPILVGLFQGLGTSSSACGAVRG